MTQRIFCSRMKTPIILDGRNCYSVESFEARKVVYDSIWQKDGKYSLLKLAGKKDRLLITACLFYLVWE